MKTFKRYIFKPLLIIVIWALVFSFIAGTADFTEWNIWLRVISVVALFYGFILNDSEIR
jgi:hypothetical protein